MTEKYYVEQIILHSQLYKRFQLDEHKDGFYSALSSLMVLNGLIDLDATLDYAIDFNGVVN